MLAVEIDGDSHMNNEKYDKHRVKELQELGIHVLRFDGHLVIKNTLGVIQSIVDWIENNEDHTPYPSQEGN